MMSREPYPPEIELSSPVRRVILVVLAVGACCGIGLCFWVNFGTNTGYVLLSVLGVGLCCRAGIWLWAYLGRRGRQLILTTLVVGAFLDTFIWLWLDTSESARRVFLTIVAYGVCCGVGSWAWANVSQRTHRLILFLCVVGICCGISIWIWPDVAENKRQQHDLQLRAQIPFRFPYAELAALDRDLQYRFAVIPDKDFGMGRVGVSHQLYVPNTVQEKATILALQRRNLQVAFYIMSRRLWTNEHRRGDWLPLQGPVYMTPPPYGFVGRRIEDSESVTMKYGVPTYHTYIRFASPDGGYVSPPVIPHDLPAENDLKELGNTIFNIASAPSKPVQFGERRTLGTKHWHIAAVPVRASDKACVSCHNARSNDRIALNDVVGVALYAYRPVAR